MWVYLEDKFDEIIWMIKRIRSAYWDFIYGMKNLYRWLPVIWKQRGWDFGFMFPLWEKQFEEMEKSFERANGFVVGNKKRLKRIRICKEICRRLKDDWWYHENQFMYHDRKWGEIDFTMLDGVFDTVRPNVKTEKDKKEETKQFLFLCKNEERHKKEDMKLLLTYIEKYWQNWWW